MSQALFSKTLFAASLLAALTMAAVPAPAATPDAAAQNVASAAETKLESNPFYKELDDMAASHNALEVSNHINQRLRADHSLFPIAMHWLEIRGLHMGNEAGYDGNYLIMYSDYLHNAGDALQSGGKKADSAVILKNSLFALMSAEAVLMADAKRCEDKTVMNVLLNRTLGPRFDALKNAYGFIDEKAYQEMSDLALQNEEQHGARQPNVALCTLGADAMNEMMSLPNLKKEVINDPNAKGGKRVRMTLPEGYKYQPKLVSDSEWNGLRGDVRNYLKTDWQNRYKINTGKSQTGSMSGQLGDGDSTKK